MNGQHHQPFITNDEIFKNRIKNGFFIEAGAYDGEIASNTLLFELEHNWTGLLIEPNPDAFEMLTKKVVVGHFFLRETLRSLSILDNIHRNQSCF